MTTKAQRKTQDDTRPHRHECTHARIDDCKKRGYCVCECGATKGTAKTSVWIKSRASKGCPGWFV